jgi:hypothetical protein
MIPRVCGVSAAVLCALTAASLCLAAEPVYGPGKGSVGGALGVSTFEFDRMLGSEWFGDYSKGAIPRFTFSGNFRYVFTPWLRFQVSPGLTWTAYDGSEAVPFVNDRFPDDLDKREYLVVMVPISTQFQYVVKRGWWLYHLGAGPGLYRVWVEQHREIVKDPITKRIHRGVYLGGSGELGAAYFLRQMPSTSVELTLTGDLAITERDEQFPSGYNSNVMAVGLRVGVSYYFTPGESRKKQTTEPAARP